MRERLISFTTCPYVQRALIVVREKGLSTGIEFIEPDDRPDWFWDLSPRGKVPLLIVGETALFESQAICEYLEEAHPEPPLMPADPIWRARDRAWFPYAGEDLLLPLYQLMTTGRESRFSRARAQLEKGLRRLGQELGESSWLSGQGQRFGMADVAVAPVFPRLELLKRWGSYELPPELANVAAWGARIMARPAVRSALPERFEADLRASLHKREAYVLKGT